MRRIRLVGATRRRTADTRLETFIDDWRFSLLLHGGQLGYDLFGVKLHQEIAWLQHP